MASIYKRGRTRWIKFQRPGDKIPCRESLGQIDTKMAELIRRRLELELSLMDPTLHSIELPSPLREQISKPIISPGDTSATAEQVVMEYIAFIKVDNSEHHRRNKMTHLRKFFGSKLLPPEPLKIIRKKKLHDEPGIFKGRLLSEVQAGNVQEMIDGLSGGTRTKRHYRNTFHALFEFALKRNHFVATNFRYPNPMAALPTYLEQNTKIIYLTQSQIDHLLGALEKDPAVRVAAAIMIYGGLRRAEMLWLRREDLAAELKFMRVVNKTDEEKDIDSSLKTGERPVPILPPLKVILEGYLPSLTSEWLVPSPRGVQWDGDNFGARHRELLKKAELKHTCLHYRHTYASQRAAEGWPLFRIAKTMGNSIAVCEKYYAAFIDPSTA